MKTINVVLIFVLGIAAIAIVQDVEAKILPLEIGGDLNSTLRIVAKLCLDAKDEPGVPEAFFGCYDQAAVRL